VAQELVPFLQGLELVQAPPPVHATQVPEPLHTMLVPQVTPGALFVSSTQVDAPVAQEVRPFLQAPGFVAQAVPAVQATQAPLLLHTRLVPQPVPAAFIVPFTHICAPVVHEATPVKQLFGLPEQLCPWLHIPQNPFPSQTWLVPQGAPAMTFPEPSTQVGAPVVHEVTPLLHAEGLLPHAPPAAHMTHDPEPSQTRLVPQPVPAVFGVPSRQIDTPVVHAVTPFMQAGWGFVLHACPVVHRVHWPLALHT
jgi:hypothetical protein